MGRGRWGGADILFWKPPGILKFFIYPWKLQTKQSFIPKNFTKLYVTFLLRPKALEIPQFFLDHHWKYYVAFIITPRNSTCFFFNTHGNSISSPPPFLSIPEKKKHGVLSTYFFQKPPGIFLFYLPPGNFRQKKAPPL